MLLPFINSMFDDVEPNNTILLLALLICKSAEEFNPVDVPRTNDLVIIDCVISLTLALFVCNAVIADVFEEFELFKEVNED